MMHKVACPGPRRVTYVENLCHALVKDQKEWLIAFPFYCVFCNIGIEQVQYPGLGESCSFALMVLISTKNI